MGELAWSVPLLCAYKKRRNLLTVERDRVNAIAEELAKMDKITEVYSVAGRYDLAAILRHKDMEELAGLATDNLLLSQKHS